MGFAIGFVAGFTILLVYSMCVAAGDSDRQADTFHRLRMEEIKKSDSEYKEDETAQEIRRRLNI